MLFAASDNYRISPKSIICKSVFRTPSYIYDGMFPFITGAYKSSKYVSDLYFLFVNLKKKKKAFNKFLEMPFVGL